MSDTSRRKFIAVAGAGAAVSTVGIATGASAQTQARPQGAQESVMAIIPDHTSGELRLLVGEREVVVNDRDLVARILNAAGGK